MPDKTIDYRDKKKYLGCLLYRLENVADSIETIESTLYEIKGQIIDDIKCAKNIFSKIEEEACALRKKRAEVFSSGLNEKISENGLFRLELINNRLALINRFTGSKLLEDFLYDGLLFYHKENYGKALEAYDSAIKMAPENAEIWFNSGIVFIGMGQFDKAVKVFEKSLEIKPDFTEAWYRICISLHKAGKYEEALKTFEDFSEQKPEDAEVWLCKGEILLESGKHENAIKAFERVLELRPDLDRACYLKGRAFFDLEKYDLALEIFNSLSEFSEVNRNSEIWLFRGESLLKKGEYESAIEVFDRVLEVKPEDLRALYLKIECLEKINSRKSDGSESGPDEEGSVKSRKTTTTTCKKSFEVMGMEINSVDKTENKPINTAKEGYSEVESSEIEKWDIHSLETSEESMLQDPEDRIECPKIWYEKGLEFIEKKKYEKALESFNKALEIDPESSFDWEIIGKIFLELGHHGKVLEAFNFALATKTPSDDVCPADRTVFDTINRYEDLLNGHKSGFNKRNQEIIKAESGFSTGKYAIEKILQYEKVSKPRKNSSKLLQEPDVSGDESSINMEGKSEENKARKGKSSREIPPVGEAGQTWQDDGNKTLDGTHEEVFEGTIEETCEEIPEEIAEEFFEVNPDEGIVTEKLIGDLRYVIINLHNLGSVLLGLDEWELYGIHDERKFYGTVRQIIEILACYVNFEGIVLSLGQVEYEGRFDIEAAKRYLFSVVDGLLSLVLRLEAGVVEGDVSGTLKEIFITSARTPEIKNLEYIVDRLKVDPIFSELSADNKILIGSETRDLKFLFENVCRLSLINPLITIVIGRNGSGKTHFLKNLEYDSVLKNKARLVLTYEFKDRIPQSHSEIIDFIYSHENFRKLFSGYRLEFGEAQTNESKIHEINDLIDRLGEQRNEKYSLCLGVDGMDAYFGEMTLKRTFDPNEIDKDITGLLGTFRNLLDCINNVCVIFALNPVNYKKLWDLARADQTHRRRIVIPNGIDGKAVELGELNEKEAYEFVRWFTGWWLERNGVDRKSISGHTDTWPFKQTAINLAWKAAPLPGSLIFALRETLNEKLNQGVSSFETLEISEMDVARFLLKNKMNPCLSANPNIWNEIEILARENEIKIGFQKFQHIYSGDLNKYGLSDAFEIYFRKLGFVRESEKDGFVIHSNTYNKKSISVKFIEGVKIGKADSRNLGKDLLSSKAGAGLFICIGNTKEYKINWDISYEEFFKDSESNMNYVSTVGLRLISRSDVFNIISLEKIDPGDRKLFAEYLDRKLGYRQYLESLEFTETSKYC